MRDNPPAAMCGLPPATAGRAPSPLLPQHEADAYGPLPAPAPHTDAELATLLSLLAAPTTLTIGHSRDAASTAAAASLAEAWRAAGRTVLALVHWPEHAASWLRPAQRFTAGRPDAWVVAAAPLGWAQMSRRLRHSTGWEPTRTFGFASVGDSRLVALAGPETLHGVRGAATDGGTWLIDRGWVTRPAPHIAPPHPMAR